MFVEVNSYREARKLYPFAAVIAKCEGGFMCFLTVTDWKIWKGQK